MVLADTAGIRNTENEVEKKGITLAIDRSLKADLNIILIDNNVKKIEPRIKDMIKENCIVVRLFLRQ